MGSWQGHELVKNKRLYKQMKRERYDLEDKAAPSKAGWKRNPPKPRIGSSAPRRTKKNDLTDID